MNGRDWFIEVTAWALIFVIVGLSIDLARADGSAFTVPKFTSGNPNYPSIAACMTHYQSLTGGCPPVVTGSDNTTKTNATFVEGTAFKRGTGCGSGSSSCYTFQCNSGFVPVAGTGNDTACKPVSSPCDEGFTYDEVGMQCVSDEEPEPGDCTEGTKRHVHYTGEAPSCVNGCRVQYPVIFTGDGIPGGVAVGTETGEQCTDGSIEIDPPPAPEPGDGYCVDNENSDVLCLNGTSENCGEINGQAVCVGQVPKGNCAYMPGGSFVCVTEKGEGPSGGPDTGTPGVDAPADWKVVTPTKDGHIWGPGTVEQSSDAPAPIDGGGSLIGESLEGFATESTLSQMLAKLREGIPIDEGETPSELPTDIWSDATDKLDEITDYIDTDVEGAEGYELPGNFTPSISACSSLSFEIMGEAMTIPGSDACALLNDLKSLMAWVFGVLTCWTCIQIGSRPMGG